MLEELREKISEILNKDTFFIDYDDRKVFLENEQKIQENIYKFININPKIIDYISQQSLNNDIITKAIEKGYELSYSSPKVLTENPEYIKIFIEHGQINIIDKIKKESYLNKDIIELAAKKGYKISRYSPKIITENPEYVEIFIQHGQIDIIDKLEEKYLNLEIIELSLEKGYELSYKSPKVLIENSNYIKAFIEHGQINTIDYADENSLTKEIIELSLEKGYKISRYSPKILTKKPEYIKIFIEHNQIDIIDYTTELGLTTEIIELAIKKGYELSYKSPKVLTENPNYIKAFIEHGQIYIIDKIEGKYLNSEIIELAIKKGYELSYKSPKVLTENSNYIKIFIENGQIDIIDKIDEKYLNSEIIELAIKKGYKISEKSSKVLTENPEYIKMFIEHGQIDAINYATEKGINEIIIKLALKKGYELKQLKLSNLVHILDKLSYDYIETLEQDIIEVYKNTKKILKESGKINTLYDNPVLSYDVVKYIYPNFGMDFTLNIIKYDTKAAENIIEEIKQGKINTIRQYLTISMRYNMFPNNSEGIHYLFKNYKKNKELIENILENSELITISLITNLKKIILNNNFFEIKNINELAKYEEIIKKKYADIYNNCDDIGKIKSHISILFGYETLFDMETEFNNFQFDNFKNLKFVLDDILKNTNDASEQQTIKEKLTLTKEEIILILAMKTIIKTNNIDELKETLKKIMSKQVDFNDKVSELKNKIRMIYTYHLNKKLTNVESLKKNSKTYQMSGVVIIEPTIEDKFNFLAHRINFYNNNNSDMISRNPSLWTQLEGTTTISTSSISEKGPWMLNPEDTNGVIYLFNQTPEDFLMYMYPSDLYISQSNHMLEPTSLYNLMIDIDTLNQKSIKENYNYNEIAGWRKGMMPCAIAYTGEIPNEDTIRAAKYFNVPIIKFNIKAYEEQKQKNQKQAMESFEKTLNYQDMYNIFYDGLNNIKIEEKIDFCMKILINKQKNKEINTRDLLTKIIELENIANRLYCDIEKPPKLIKLELFKLSLCTFLKLSQAEVVELETAQLGESGIMYKLKENGEQYLVKPAVDKDNYEPQSFRAEIQEAASKLQAILSSNTTVNVESIGIGNLQFSKQPLIEVDKQETKKLIEWFILGGELDTKYKDALLREYVVDFLLCNFDSFCGNFIIDKNGNLRGVDKEQSFKFINDQQTLKPNFSYEPNGGDRVPIYQSLFERYNNGELALNLNIVEETIEKAKTISDEEYKKIFEKYAEALDKNNSEIILSKIIERKHKAINILEDYINKLKQNKKNRDNNEQIQQQPLK